MTGWCFARLDRSGRSIDRIGAAQVAIGASPTAYRGLRRSYIRLGKRRSVVLRRGHCLAILGLQSLNQYGSGRHIIHLPHALA